MGLFLAMYGNDVHIGEAIFISLFAMAIVFIILLIISYLIDITAGIIAVRSGKKVKVSNENVVKKEGSNTSDSSLVAVIAAAVASMMGTSVDNIRITKIKRVNQNNTAWTGRGLLDKMN